MKYAILAVLLHAVVLHAASNLAITPAANGTDYLWLSCLSQSDTGYLWRYNGTENQACRVFPETIHGISSTITFDGTGDRHLMVIVDHTLFSMETWSEMAAVDSVVLLAESEWCVPGLLRRSNAPAWGLVSRYMADYMSSGAAFQWLTREYTVSSSGMITLGDSLFLIDPYPLMKTDYPEDLVHNLVFPVVDAEGSPVMAERTCYPGYGPWPGSYGIATQCHNTTASQTYLTADTLTWSTTESPEPELLASGSCENEALFLWSDSTTGVNYSVHDCVNGVTGTCSFPGDGPANLQAAAMSACPDDPGLLLLWQDGSDIYCRHYQGGWNDYAYLLRTGVAPLNPGEMAVCSVENGYWAAYMESSEPVVFFVDRNSITGINHQGEPVQPVNAAVFPSPFSSSLCVTVPGEEQFRAELFDTSGRLVAEGKGNCSLLLDTSELPAGCYTISVTYHGYQQIRKLVLVR